jgi:phosphoglycolate phosphatase-like HAD superfamily hydrolase
MGGTNEKTYKRHSMRQKIKVIALDFDGTLVESNKIKDNAFYSIFGEWPEHRTAMMKWHIANNMMFRQDKFRYFVEVILGRQGDYELIGKLTQKFSELSYKAIVDCSMVDGAQEFLDSFRNKVPMLLVSATPHDELKKILTARLLTRYFKEVQGGPINKTEVLKKFISIKKISPDEILYIGDSPEDLQTAKTLGSHFIGRKSCRELNTSTYPIYTNFVKIKDHLDLCYAF